MLALRQILAALDAKRDRFSSAEKVFRQDLETLAQTMEQMSAMSREEIEVHLAEYQNPGARPTAEHQKNINIIIPFAEKWSNHSQARGWAMGILHGVPTLATDGSQISPSKDVSIPVGVVQVGWFENRHQPDGSYVKDIQVEVLAPDELSSDDTPESVFPDWHINWRRFKLEVDLLTDYMNAKAGVKPKPLCFFDGSLIVSFTEQMRPDRQQLYTDAVRRLLETSEKTGIPLVGYVDTSYANDLVVMLGHVFNLNLSGRVTDADMLRLRMHWGDRSQVFICARDDRVSNRYYEQVCFIYLKTTADSPPARIEFPRWIYEAGEHERVFDLVRAECVVGIGYPYSLETADAVAVLTMQDRDKFYRLFQRFAEKEELPLRFSRKATSKRGRRV